MTWLLLTLAAQAKCPSNDADIILAVERAKTAFVEMDEEGFATNRATAMSDLACLDDRIGEETVASVHLLVGLECFIRGDGGCAEQSFARARAIQPGLALGEQIAPAGGPLDRVWQTAATERPADQVSVSVPSGRWLVVDGKVSVSRAESRGAVVQYVLTDGKVQWTGYVAPFGALPPWPLAPEERSVVVPPGDDGTGTVKTGKNVGLKVASVGGMALSAGMYGAAYAIKLRFEEVKANGGDDSIPEQYALKSQNHTLVISSAVLGAASAGVGVVAFTAKW